MRASSSLYATLFLTGCLSFACSNPCFAQQESPKPATTPVQVAGQVLEQAPEQTANDDAEQETEAAHGAVQDAALVENKTLVVKGAGEPVPALKYRFWVPDHRLKPGSAQLHFMRALVIWNQFPIDFRTKVEGWSDVTKLGEAEEVSAALKSLDDELYNELHALAISEDQRWDHRLRDLQGTAIYTYTFPEIVQSRSLARLLDVRISHQITNGEIDAALTSIQDGFRLAAFIGGGETLIQQLVAVAITGIMFEKVEQLMQTEAAPNLYWALATLPNPLIDLRKSVMQEMEVVKRVIPLLEEARSDDRPDEYWQKAWDELLQQFEDLGVESEENLKALAEIGSTAETAARERLLKSSWRVKGGLGGAQVKSMPALRAVLLDTAREIEILSDDLVKNTLLPATFRGESAEKRLNDYIAANRLTSGGAIIVGMLFPAVDAVRATSIRQTYFVNRLLTIEALRMHAATHNGELPKSLSELSPVPAFPNPYTAAHFDYKVDIADGKAIVTLQADGPEEIDFFKSIKIAFPMPTHAEQK